MMSDPESCTNSDDVPTPKVLREADAVHKPEITENDENGRVEPSPAECTKRQIFKLSDYEAIDARARQVGSSEPLSFSSS